LCRVAPFRVCASTRMERLWSVLSVPPVQASRLNLNKCKRPAYNNPFVMSTNNCIIISMREARKSLEGHFVMSAGR
jgi:hypothetical protein